MTEVLGLVSCLDTDTLKHAPPAWRSRALLPFAGQSCLCELPIAMMAHSGVQRIALLHHSRDFRLLWQRFGAGHDAAHLTYLQAPPDARCTGLPLQALCDNPDLFTAAQGRDLLFADTRSVCFPDLRAMYALHKESGADLTLLIKRALSSPTGGWQVRLHADGSIAQMQKSSLCQTDCFLGYAFFRLSQLPSLLQRCSKACRTLEEALFSSFTQLLAVPYFYDACQIPVDTLQHYLDCNLMLLQKDAYLRWHNLPHWAGVQRAPSALIAPGASVQRSLLSAGCSILGRVKNSVLSENVTVGPGSDVEDCLLFPNAQIGANCTLRSVIVAESVTVRDGFHFFGQAAYPYVCMH